MSEPEADANSRSNLVELREILLGDQIQKLEELRCRLDDPDLRSIETSRILAQALSLSIQPDRKVQSALQPIVEEALRVSVEKDPGLLAATLFPIIGQAVRKAVANSFQQLLDSLNATFAEGLSLKRLRWRVEARRTGKSFGEIALAHSLAFRVEQVYLIHRKTGILLAESSKQPGLLKDADLVVGMLTALQDFVRDSFTGGQQDDLEVLHIGEFRVWLMHGPLAILSVVVRGQLPKELQIQFSEKIERLHKTFRGQFVSFEMSEKPIPGIGNELDDCLLGEAPLKRPSYAGVKIVAGIVLAALCTDLFLRIREDIRWREYLAALRREPGIVVVDASHGWSTFSVAGLRDPLARNPMSLLPGFHLAEKNVSEHWDEYLSLDSGLVRLRRLEDEVAALGKEKIRFDVNTTKIPLDQLPLVDTVSDQIRELSRNAALQGGEIQVKIVGHTDPTGDASLNSELSEDRARTLMLLLEERGIDPKILSVEGLGDKQPNRPGANAYEQNLDRRTTFVPSITKK